MIAAVKAKGRTVIEMRSWTEITDAATLFEQICGAYIRGAGTDIIIIDGVEKLHGTRQQVIPDRIEVEPFHLRSGRRRTG